MAVAFSQINHKTHTEDVISDKNVTFESMHLKNEIIRALTEKDFIYPSPIQEQAIPVILSGRDVLARAKNGTGKTASFLIPVIQKINNSLKKIQALILAPTRELALQISNVCSELSKFTSIKIHCLIGGFKLADDLKIINDGVQILIASPGRLSEVYNKRLVDFSHVSMICIDEADVIVTNETVQVLRSLLFTLSVKPQLVLVSATFPRSIAEFRVSWISNQDKHMSNVAEINTMKEFTLKGVSQFYAFVEESDKVACLYTILSKLKINQCVVFCNSVIRVSLLTEKLIELGFKCSKIHSKMPQIERNAVFEDFKRGNSTILVCSDIFNRGIDIEAVNIVVNFDLPTKSATYLHRIGRSGRFGRLGLGISFVSDYNKSNYIRLCSELGADVKPIPKDVNIDSRLYT